MNRLLALTLALVVPLLSSLAWAADGLPGYYPGVFERSGTIDIVSKDQNNMIVDDVEYLIWPNVAVHTPETRFASKNVLKTGTKIGFKTEPGSNNTLNVTEIWVLPEDYEPEANGDGPALKPVLGPSLQ